MSSRDSNRKAVIPSHKEHQGKEENKDNDDDDKKCRGLVPRLLDDSISSDEEDKVTVIRVEPEVTIVGVKPAPLYTGSTPREGVNGGVASQPRARYVSNSKSSLADSSAATLNRARYNAFSHGKGFTNNYNFAHKFVPGVVSPTFRTQVPKSTISLKKPPPSSCTKEEPNKLIEVKDGKVWPVGFENSLLKHPTSSQGSTWKCDFRPEEVKSYSTDRMANCLQHVGGGMMILDGQPEDEIIPVIEKPRIIRGWKGMSKKKREEINEKNRIAQCVYDNEMEKHSRYVEKVKRDVKDAGGDIIGELYGQHKTPEAGWMHKFPKDLKLCESTDGLPPGALLLRGIPVMHFRANWSKCEGEDTKRAACTASSGRDGSEGEDTKPVASAPSDGPDVPSAQDQSNGSERGEGIENQTVSGGESSRSLEFPGNPRPNCNPGSTPSLVGTNGSSGRALVEITNRPSSANKPNAGEALVNITNRPSPDNTANGGDSLHASAPSAVRFNNNGSDSKKKAANSEESARSVKSAAKGRRANTSGHEQTRGKARTTGSSCMSVSKNCHFNDNGSDGKKMAATSQESARSIKSAAKGRRANRSGHEQTSGKPSAKDKVQAKLIPPNLSDGDGFVEDPRHNKFYIVKHKRWHKEFYECDKNGNYVGNPYVPVFDINWELLPGQYGRKPPPEECYEQQERQRAQEEEEKQRRRVRFDLPEDSRKNDSDEELNTFMDKFEEEQKRKSGTPPELKSSQRELFASTPADHKQTDHEQTAGAIDGSAGSEGGGNGTADVGNNVTAMSPHPGGDSSISISKPAAAGGGEIENSSIHGTDGGDKHVNFDTSNTQTGENAAGEKKPGEVVAGTDESNSVKAKKGIKEDTTRCADGVNEEAADENAASQGSKGDGKTCALLPPTPPPSPVRQVAVPSTLPRSPMRDPLPQMAGPFLPGALHTPPSSDSSGTPPKLNRDKDKCTFASLEEDGEFPRMPRLDSPAARDEESIEDDDNSEGSPFDPEAIRQEENFDTIGEAVVAYVVRPLERINDRIDDLKGQMENLQNTIVVGTAQNVHANEQGIDWMESSDDDSLFGLKKARAPRKVNLDTKRKAVRNQEENRKKKNMFIDSECEEGSEGEDEKWEDAQQDAVEATHEPFAVVTKRKCIFDDGNSESSEEMEWFCPDDLQGNKEVVKQGNEQEINESSTKGSIFRKKMKTIHDDDEEVEEGEEEG